MLGSGVENELGPFYKTSFGKYLNNVGAFRTLTRNTNINMVGFTIETEYFGADCEELQPDAFMLSEHKMYKGVLLSEVRLIEYLSKFSEKRRSNSV